MSRLIEAEKLESAVARAFGIMRANGLDVTCEAKIIMPIIKFAPAVDVIPVAWLKEKHKHMFSTGQDTPEQAIAYVLWLWQKEQEAKTDA